MYYFIVYKRNNNWPYEFLLFRCTKEMFYCWDKRGFVSFKCMLLRQFIPQYKRNRVQIESKKAPSIRN